MKRYVNFFLLFIIPMQFAFSQENEWDTPEPMRIGDTLVHGLIGSGETLLSNGIFMVADMIYGFSWAFPTVASIRANFSSPWDWEDTDDFVVNHIGHPYHGSLYFNSGRVNGFSFYGSLFFSVLGSFTWETIAETNRASTNDFIATVAGSLSTGEMLYRLFAEAYSAGIPLPLAFFINPVAGFHSLVTGWKPPKASGNLNCLQVYLGMGFAETHYSVSVAQEEVFSFRGPFADIGVKVVYGSPFDQNSHIPFRQFELALSLGMNPGAYSNFRVISDGYLFSFSPIYTDKNSMSTGLSLHLDFACLGKFSLQDSTINQYSDALDWTVKYQHLFSTHTALQIKTHTGLTFWGASKYYSPDTEVDELNNYGFGFNSKNFFSLENKRLGGLEFDVLLYALWTCPGTTVFSNGTVLWVFSELTYSYPVSEHIYIGITRSSVGEQGSFSGFPDTRKRNNSTKLFVAWNL